MKIGSIFCILIVFFFFCVRYMNLFCLGFFRFNESIGFLCIGVKYLILIENKYIR